MVGLNKKTGASPAERGGGRKQLKVKAEEKKPPGKIPGKVTPTPTSADEFMAQPTPLYQYLVSSIRDISTVGHGIAQMGCTMKSSKN